MLASIIIGRSLIVLLYIMAYFTRTLLFTGVPLGCTAVDIKLLLADIIPAEASLEFVLFDIPGEVFCIFSEDTDIREVYRASAGLKMDGAILKVSSIPGSEEGNLTRMVEVFKETQVKSVPHKPIDVNDLLQDIASLSAAQKATLIAALYTGDPSNPKPTSSTPAPTSPPKPTLRPPAISPLRGTRQQVYTTNQPSTYQPSNLPRPLGSGLNQPISSSFLSPFGQPQVIAHSTMPPRIATFSGDPTAKGDATYQQWRFEVRGLIRDGIYSEPSIMQSIRRSLRGVAADVLQHLNENATVTQILAKLEMIFGNVMPTEAIYEKFYTARQLPGEDVSHWACRIEDLLAQLRAKDLHIANPSMAESMVRTKFYSGLKSATVKNNLRHRFDRNESYAELLISARRAELEETDGYSQQVTSSDSSADTNKKLDALLAHMEKMQTRIDRLEAKQRQPYSASEQTTSSPTAKNPSSSASSTQKSYNFKGNCYKCGNKGHKKPECPLNL